MRALFIKDLDEFVDPGVLLVHRYRCEFVRADHVP
jgi:hypothetical protein